MCTLLNVELFCGKKNNNKGELMAHRKNKHPKTIKTCSYFFREISGIHSPWEMNLHMIDFWKDFHFYRRLNEHPPNKTHSDQVLFYIIYYNTRFDN